MAERLAKLLRDRFVWFVLLGLALFVVDRATDREGYRIHVGPEQLTMLQGRWKAQSGLEPTAEELAALVEHHIEEEVLVREARRLGLDRDDVILRRRLAQKMEFLIRDGLQEPTPTPAALNAFFEQHRDRYVRPKRVGFRHVFLGNESQAAARDIAGLLEVLATDASGQAWRTLGVAFMLAREYSPRTHAQLAELFGTAFADRLLEEPAAGQWWGPARSSYGMHLVQVVVVEPAREPGITEVLDQLTTDYRAARLQTAEAAARARLRERYAITVEDAYQ